MMRAWTISKAALALTLAACAARAGEIERSFPADPDAVVTIYNKKGSLDIVGWDQPQIRVTGTVGNDSTTVEIDDDADDPEIEVESTSWISGASEARLTVYVPRAVSLEIETVSASIEISGVAGESMEIETTSGNIEAAASFSEIEIEGVSGSINLTGGAGNASISNVSGKITVTGDVKDIAIETVSGGIETDVSGGSVRAETVSGTIRLGVTGASEVAAESVSGSIRFEGGLASDGEMEMHVLSGSITIEFAQPPQGEYSLSTFSGGIDCELEPLRNLQRDGKKMEFDFGDGEGSVDLESFSGSIEIR